MVVLCLMSAAQALAGLRLPKGKKRPEIRATSCASQVREGRSCQDTTSMCGVVCRLRGWDGGREARPRVEPLYGSISLSFLYDYGFGNVFWRV